MSRAPRALVIAAFLGVLIGASTTPARAGILAMASQARLEARRLRPDAELVQIDVMSFALAMNPSSGFPDLSRVGPPAAVLFYYLSPGAHRQIRVLVRADLSPAQQRFLQERGLGRVQAEELAHPVSPYAVAVADRFIELDDALARAERGGFLRECAGVNPSYGCGRPVRAELHAEEPGRPLWTITFGQDAQARSIVRHVDALTGAVVTADEARRAPFSSLSVRLVLSGSLDDDAPSAAAIRDGQPVALILLAQGHTRVVNPVSCVVFVSRATGREGRQQNRECKPVEGTFEKGLRIVSRTTFQLAPGRSSDVIDITWSLTANGVTQEAHNSVRVSR